MKSDDNKQDLPENLVAINKVLDSSIEQIDQDTLTALSEARAQAVQHVRDAAAGKAGKKSAWQGWLWPTGGLATAMAAVLAVIMLSSGPVNIGGELGASEFEILASNDSLEMIEDLEFYQWLSDYPLDEAGESG